MLRANSGLSHSLSDGKTDIISGNQSNKRGTRGVYMSTGVTSRPEMATTNKKEVYDDDP